MAHWGDLPTRKDPKKIPRKYKKKVGLKGFLLKLFKILWPGVFRRNFALSNKTG